jgi:hypothetical protein
MSSNGSGKYNMASFQIARLFRLGGTRVSLLKCKDVADDGGEIWLLSEAPERAQPVAQNGDRAPHGGEDTRGDWQRPAERLASRREPDQRRQPLDDGEIQF